MCFIRRRNENWSQEICDDPRAHVVGVNYESTVDGEGIRIAIFFGGCLHQCPGCHNPEAHPFNVGRPFDDKLQDDIVRYAMTHPYIQGITLTGGDPMYSASHIIPFVERVKMMTDLDVWCYSGFTIEEIRADRKMSALLCFCDVLVDGPFVEELSDPSLSFRGSSNQRIHYLGRKYRSV